MKGQQGFTLIELMIVVVIIAILAAFAVPNYLRYSIRAGRVDGQNLLMRAADAQERYYATFNHYGSLDELGYTSAAGKRSEKGFYELSMVPASGSTSSTFTATATPVTGGPQQKDDCGALTIDNAGRKGQSGQTTNGRCW